MFRDVAALVKPAAVAIVGASSKRASQGNVVLQNLLAWKYPGRILPVHPTAAEIDGLPAFPAAAALPAAVDTAIVAVPAAEVLDTLRALEAAGVRSANVFSNGFSAAEEAALRAFGAATAMSINGPNCMGLVNFTDAAPLYPSRPSLRLRPGPVALVAQSGSAAISIMNTIGAGLSKMVTVGSEYQVTAADYLLWLAGDEATRAVGVVAESIADPVAFAHAAERLHAAGKALTVLKVGRSALGNAATQAHTGALIASRDAFDCFFRACDIATANDYDELVASLECAVTARRMSDGGRGLAIAGISGGQTALACDIAADTGLALARFSEATVAAVHAAAPGAPGSNPLDIGSTVKETDRKTRDAIDAMLQDADVGALVLLQDSQASLNPRTFENYMRHIPNYGEMGRTANKPVVMISPTGEGLHPGILEALAGTGVPVLRGLRAGLVAAAHLGCGRPGFAGAWAEARQAKALRNPKAAEWRRQLAETSDAVPPALAFDILRSYGVPVVKSLVVPSAEAALARAAEVGWPLVVKVASRQINHRSDVGGVVLDVRDAAALRTALATIARNVAQHAPAATIDGYELQQQFEGDAEAMVGFAATAPFGSLMVVGSGGTQVELLNDRAVELAPLTQDEAVTLVRRTRLGRLLDGYRRLLPPTDILPLAAVLKGLSDLAADIGDLVAACDLNPVLVKKGSGQVCVVDALMVRR